MFTKEELQNLLALMNRVDLKGSEAITFAVLQQKISGLINPPATPKEEEK